MIDGSSVKVIPASSRVSSSGGEERTLVDVEADPVAHPVAEVLSQSRLLDGAAAGGVDLPRERARPASGASRLGGGEHHVVRAREGGLGSPATTVRPKSEQ